MTDPQVMRLARELADVKRQIQSLSLPSLAYSSIEDGAVAEFDQGGTQTAQFGQQYDGTHGAATLVSPTPPTPYRPTALTTAGGLTVGWGGTFADPTSGAEDITIVAPMDYDHVDVHVVPHGQPPLASVPVTSIRSARGGQVFVPLEPGQYDVALVTRTTAGTPSVLSAIVAEYAGIIAIPDPTDGNAPTTSPTPTCDPGIRSVFLRWTAVTNPDPVTYDIHVSPTSGFAPGPSTLVASTGATLANVRTLADGTALDYATQYAFRLVARDADGAAPAGGEALCTPLQATSADIAVDYVYAGQVNVNQLVSGNLSAVMALLGQLTVAGTSGARIDISPLAGLKLTDSFGRSLVNLPLDGSANTFEGDIIARALTILGNLSMRGTTNELSRNSLLTLAAGTTAPSNAPILSELVYAPTAAPGAVTKPTDTSVATGTLDATGFVRATGGAWTTDGAYQARVVYNGRPYPSRLPTEMHLEIRDRVAGTSTLSPALTLPTGMAAFFPNNAGYAAARVVRVGAEWIVLADYAASTAVDAVRATRVVRYNATTFAKNGEWTLTRTAGTIVQVPSLATDGTSLYVGEGRTSSSTFTIRKFSTTGALTSTITPSVTGTGASGTGSSALVLHPVVGNFDFGSPRFMVSDGVLNYGGCAVLTATGTQTANEQMTSVRYLPDAQAFWGGLLRNETWDKPTAAAQTSVATNSFTYPAATTSRLVGVAYTWYDSDATGGNHETPLSPVSTITIGPRCGVAVTTNSPNDDGTVDSPDAVRIYANTTGVPTSLKLIATVVGPDPYLFYDAVTFPGAAAPTTNNFPSSAASELRTAVGGFSLKGDGSGDWPALRASILSDANATYATDADVTALTNATTAGAWVTLTVTGTGWTATSGLEPKARLLPNGDIEVQGAVSSGSGTTAVAGTVLTLPVGMRPTRVQYLSAHRTSGGSSGKSFNAIVLADGSLQISLTYHEGTAIQASVAYPISGIIPLT